MRHGVLAIGAMLLAPMLAGCEKAAPSGQVVATINGEEITNRDLQAELGSANLAPGADTKALMPIALAKIVDRKLVAAQGRQLGVDKTPEYLAITRRADELILGEQTLARWNSDVPAPSAADIQRFIAGNPAMFGDRSLVAIVQFRTAATKLGMDALGPIKTMSAVEALLRERGIAFETGRSTLDTAQLSRGNINQLRAAANGEPLVERQGDVLVISAVTDIRPAPLPEGVRRDFAVQQLQRQDLQRRVESLRKSAKIDYKKGFAPPAAPTTPARQP